MEKSITNANNNNINKDRNNKKMYILRHSR